ncbi:MAG TPA: serine hydroxymethyltransferase [Candidatus Paceibacterota bacterium]|jgi:glycine hydroxymethyltransferase|nr:serine hydroxymethyltransferase [Candidatus Paceibacterota bacterium]
MNDREVEQLLEAEAKRQQDVVNLIASENYASEDVLKALGSTLTNKYAEGYPGARYYGGNVHIDAIENLAQQRALELFNLSPAEWSVNVQALSGTPANMAVYSALLPHDGGSIMALSLDQGGHLSHGHAVSMTGKLWKQIPYTLDPETEIINHDIVRDIALKEKPNMIVAGYTAYSRIVDWDAFRAIADECDALLHVDASHIAGLIAGGVYPSPFAYADTVVMTTHKTLRGPRGALIFSRKQLSDKINKAVFPGLQGGPHMNTIAGIAVALHEAMQPEFQAHARQVIDNAKALATALEEKGWRIVSGGTDTHLFLVDTFIRGIGGQAASDALEKEGIIVNKNAIPFDTRSPMDPSGIRIGTPAETTRGKNEEDMRAIAERIDSILKVLEHDN